MFPAAFFFSMYPVRRAAPSLFLLYRIARCRVSAARTLEIPITTVTTVKTMDFKMVFFKFMPILLPCAAHARGVVFLFPAPVILCAAPDAAGPQPSQATIASTVSLCCSSAPIAERPSPFCSP